MVHLLLKWPFFSLIIMIYISITVVLYKKSYQNNTIAISYTYTLPFKPVLTELGAAETNCKHNTDLLSPFMVNVLVIYTSSSCGGTLAFIRSHVSSYLMNVSPIFASLPVGLSELFHWKQLPAAGNEADKSCESEPKH